MTRLPKHHQKQAPKAFVRLSIAAFFLLFYSGAQAQWLTGWDYRKEITLDGSQIAGAGTHTDFPLLISLTDADLAARALSSGHDIVFTSSNGTSELEHELESYTSGTGTVVAWVQVTLTGSTDNTIYMYYGNASAVDPTLDATDTWDANYELIYHMAGTDDATSNNRDATSGGTPTTVAAKVGQGQDFDGGSSGSTNRDFFDTNYLGNLTSWTISAWVYADAAPSNDGSASIISGESNFNLGWNHTSATYRGTVYFKHNTDSWNNVSYTPLSGTTWYYLTGSYNSATGELKAFRDGQEINSVTLTSGVGNEAEDRDITIARHAGDGTGDRNEWLAAIIDEVRISSVARSDDWIQTEYNNQNTPGEGGFIKTLGAQETACPSAGTASADTTTPEYDGSSNLSLTGFIPGHLGIQWQESTDNVSFSPIAGATSDLYTETNVTATKYFRATVDYDSCIATSNVVTIFAETQFDTDYCKRKLITIDNSQVSGSSNLTDFPLYFSTTDNDLRTVANGGFVESAQGWDIVFTADDGVTELDHEIDSYDGSTGTYKGWVRIPSLSYNTDTEIYMYFGNSAATDPDANDELVWDSNYQGVYHLNNDYLDATSNDRDGTNSGTDNFGSTPLTAGRDFQDQADKVTTGLTTTFSSTVTISAWIRWENINHGHNFPLIYEKTDESKLIAYRASGSNERRLRFEGLRWTGGNPAYSNTQLNPGDWYYVSVVFDLSTLNDVTFYINGVDDGLSNTPGNTTLGSFGSSDGLVIGNRTNSQRGFGGQIEEFRISNIKRSADWIATEYANQNDPGSFYTINAIEGVVEAGTATAADDNLINNTSTTISLSGNGSSTIQWQSSSDNVTFTDIGGETSATLNTGNLTSTTYYRAEVGAGCSNYSNVVTVNVQVAFDGAFCKRKKITIDADQVMGSSNLTDFPFYFEITDPDLRTVANGGFVASSAGWDITFSEDDGTTTLDHEIEFYDETTGTYKGWVRIPTLSYNQDTEIYLYFGNGSATDPDADDESVWSSGYQLAYHFIDNYEDATANNRDATAVGTNLNAAQFNKGVFYNSAADVVNSSYTGSLTQFTVSGWYKLESLSTNFPGLFQKLNAVKALVNNNGTSGPIGAIRFQPEGFSGSNDWWFSTQLQEGNTYYLTFTYDGSSHTNDPILYINGVSDAIDEGETARPSGGSIASNSNVWQVGNINAALNRGFGGAIDEFRVYNAIRTPEWIATEYNNQGNPSTFYTVEEIEFISDPGTIEALDTSLDFETGTTLTLSGNDAPTIQWQSSTDNFNFTDIGGATSSSYATPNLTQTTFYRAMTTTGSCDFFSNTVQVVVRGEFLPEFSRRTRLTIDHSVVEGGENLTDFPFLFHVTDNDLRTQANGGGVFDSNGSDIVFTAGDGTTIIPSEQLSYNPTTGELMVWVAIPTLYASVDTELYVYFGSCTFSSAPATTDTWDSNYAGVWHLNNSLEDATANNYDGVNSGSTNNASGQIQQGRSFNGSSQHVTVTSTELQTANSFTISAWFQADDLSSRRMLFWQGEAGGNGWGDGTSPWEQEMHLSVSDVDNRYDGDWEPENRLGFFLGNTDRSNDDNVIQFSVPFSDTGGKHHVAVRVMDLGTSPRAVMYIDGQYVGEDDGDPSRVGRGSWANAFLFGKDGGSSRYYDGMLDEVRVSTVARSEGWIATSYNNQLNPAANIALDGQTIELQWTGAALSSAWSTGNNWGDCQTPVSGADIRIRDTGGNPYPQLTGSTTVGTLTVDPGTSIDLGGQQLTVTGSVENNGTLTIPANSEVLFTGSTDQRIYGSTAIPAWEDVTVNNSGGNVILSAPTTISGDLTLTSGHLDCTEGNLTVVGNIVGGTSSSFIIIPEGRSVTQNSIGPGGKSGTVLFPVGSSSTSYTPAQILNAGTDDDFTVGLLNNSYQDGTSGAVLSDKELAKTWLIDEATPGGSNVTMTLQWHDANEGGNFDRTNAFIAHYASGGFWEKHGSAGMSTTMGGGYYAVTASGLSDFSPHTVASGDSPLPVELLSFTASRLANAVRLNWSTATEINNDFFSVERGTDGASFQILGLVDGQGNSDHQVDYEFLDPRPLPGNSYYRLKQTDFDGTFSYSEVILVQDGVARTPGLSIFPNANNGLDFNWALQGLTPNTQVHLTLYDLQGNVIIEHTRLVDATGAYTGRGFEGVRLDPGLYLLKASNAGNDMVSRLIVR